MDQTNLIQLIEALAIGAYEHELVEFKHNFHSANEIGEDLSALANSACLQNIEQAYLVFGVEDVTHHIRDTSFDPYKKKAKGNEDLIPWLSRMFTPKLAFRFENITMPTGEHVVLCTIPAANQFPIAFMNVAYIRIGSTTKKLADYPDEQAKIWRKSTTDWSAAICDGATIQDLSPIALVRARTLFLDKVERVRVETKSMAAGVRIILTSAPSLINCLIINIAL